MISKKLRMSVLALTGIMLLNVTPVYAFSLGDVKEMPVIREVYHSLLASPNVIQSGVNLNRKIKNAFVKDINAIILDTEGDLWQIGYVSSYSVNSTDYPNGFKILSGVKDMYISRGAHPFIFYEMNDGSVKYQYDCSRGIKDLRSASKFKAFKGNYLIMEDDSMFNINTSSSNEDIKPITLKASEVKEICGNVILKNDGTFTDFFRGSERTSIYKYVNKEIQSAGLTVDSLLFGYDHSESTPIFYKCTDGKIYSQAPKGSSRISLTGSSVSDRKPHQIYMPDGHSFDQVKTVVSNDKDCSFLLFNDGTSYVCAGGSGYGSGVGGNTGNAVKKVNLKDIEEIYFNYYKAATIFKTKDNKMFGSGDSKVLGLETSGSTSDISPIDIPNKIVADLNNYVGGYGSSSFITKGGLVYSASLFTYDKQTVIPGDVKYRNITSSLTQHAVNTVADITSNLEEFSEYGDLSKTIYGTSYYNDNKLCNMFTGELCDNIDPSEIRYKEGYPDGTLLLIDNHGSANYYKTLSDSPEGINVDGNNVVKSYLTMLGRDKAIVMELKDNSIKYFKEEDTSTVSNMPLHADEIVKKFQLKNRGGRVDKTCFALKNGDIVYFDENLIKTELSFKCTDVKEIIPATNDNPTLFVMTDGIIKDVNDNTYGSDGKLVKTVLSNRFVVLDDGFIYTIWANDFKSTGISPNAVKGVVNDIILMKNGNVKRDVNGSLQDISEASSKDNDRLVALGTNDTYVINKYDTTYGVGQFVKGNIEAFGINYKDIAALITNNYDFSALLLKDGTVYTEPSTWSKTNKVVVGNVALQKIQQAYPIEFVIDPSITPAREALEKVEKTLDKKDYADAEDKVNKVPSCPQKKTLEKRLKDVKDKIDGKEKIAEATKLVEVAEKSKLQKYVDKARAKVNEIPDIYTKERNGLIQRLEAIKVESDEDLEPKVDAFVNDVEETIKRSNHSTSDLEGLKNQGESLQQAVDKMQQDENKVKLSEKLKLANNKVNKELEDIKNAREAVNKVKSSKEVNDFIDALEKVNDLTDSKDKKEMHEELMNIFDTILDGKSNDDIISIFDKLIGRIPSGKMPKADVQSLVVKVKDQPTRKKIEDKLNGSTPQVSDLPNKIKVAKDAVDNAEKTKSPSDYTIARDIVNALPECSEKDSLSQRLSKLTQPSDVVKGSSSAHMDVGVSTQNTIVLTLSKNSIDFKDYNGAKDSEELNAVEAVITSSLPYTLNVTMESSLIGSDPRNKIQDGNLKMRISGEKDYTSLFPHTPFTAVKSHESGRNIKHPFDLKLTSDSGAKMDRYKTSIKFEAIQD